MSISVGFIFLISLILLKKNFVDSFQIQVNKEYQEIFKLAVFAFFINLGLTFLNNIDILLVKHYFDTSTAGSYAALVTVGKVLLFGAGQVGVVMFPQISEILARKENPFLKFKGFLLVQILLLAVSLGVFFFFPKLVVFILFPRFMEVAPYLPLFSVFMSIYVLSAFYILFFIALGKIKVALLEIIPVLLQFVLISMFHKSLFDVIYSNIVASAFLLVSLLIYYKFTSRDILKTIPVLSSRT